MKEEHARMMCERENMATNDREDLFKRHYNNVMEELQRQAEAEQVMKDERQKEYGTVQFPILLSSIQCLRYILLDVLRKAREEVFNIIER